MPDTESVQISVPADSAYVATLRLVAASLAARSELTIDEIEDLRLAVDEACALLLPHSNGQLVGHFVPAPGLLTVTVSAPGGSGQLDHSGFAWQVLAALADSVEVGDAPTLQLTLTKRRQAVSQ